MCGPLSVRYMTKVLSAMPRSSSALRTVPTFLSWSIMASWYGLCQRPAWPMLSGLVWVRKCMWVKFTQTKAGLPASFCRWMKSTARSAMSSSIVSIRFLVSGPVSLHDLLADLAEARIHRRVVRGRGLAVQHAARAELGAERRVLRVVRQFRLFLGVEVVEVAVELVEAVHGGQELVAVAQVVLAELAGGIALRLQQLGDRRVFLLQPYRGARQADLGQAGAQAGLAGDERRPAGGAALLGVVVGEHHAFLGDAVDVGRLIAHQAASSRR